MTTWGRRIRATIGMGFTWAAAWFVAGLLLARVPGFDSDLPYALVFAPLGFLSGVIFSGVLVASEGRRRFEHMSLARFAGWGGLSGLLLSGVFLIGATFGGESLGGELIGLALALSTASAVCAAGSLAMARRAESRELTSPGEH